MCQLIVDQYKFVYLSVLYKLTHINLHVIYVNSFFIQFRMYELVYMLMPNFIFCPFINGDFRLTKFCPYQNVCVENVWMIAKTC